MAKKLTILVFSLIALCVSDITCPSVQKPIESYELSIDTFAPKSYDSNVDKEEQPMIESGLDGDPSDEFVPSAEEIFSRHRKDDIVFLMDDGLILAIPDCDSSKGKKCPPK